MTSCDPAASDLGVPTFYAGAEGGTPPVACTRDLSTGATFPALLWPDADLPTSLPSWHESIHPTTFPLAMSPYACDESPMGPIAPFHPFAAFDPLALTGTVGGGSLDKVRPNAALASPTALLGSPDGLSTTPPNSHHHHAIGALLDPMLTMAWPCDGLPTPASSSLDGLDARMHPWSDKPSLRASPELPFPHLDATPFTSVFTVSSGGPLASPMSPTFRGTSEHLPLLATHMPSPTSPTFLDPTLFATSTLLAAGPALVGTTPSSLYATSALASTTLQVGFPASTFPEPCASPSTCSSANEGTPEYPFCPCAEGSCCHSTGDSGSFAFSSPSPSLNSASPSSSDMCSPLGCKATLYSLAPSCRECRDGACHVGWPPSPAGMGARTACPATLPLAEPCRTMPGTSPPLAPLACPTTPTPTTHTPGTTPIPDGPSTLPMPVPTRPRHRVPSHPGHPASHATFLPPPSTAHHPPRRRRHSAPAGTSFVCAVCEKEFARAFNLKSHMKTHTPERPFVCPNCQKGFARKHDCVRHMRVHTKERPYKCLGCNKSFARHDALARHVRVDTSCVCHVANATSADVAAALRPTPRDESVVSSRSSGGSLASSIDVVESGSLPLEAPMANGVALGSVVEGPMPGVYADGFLVARVRPCSS